MLQTIRDNTRGVIAGILIGFLVIIFALSGAEALFSGGASSGEVASVGGETITENDVVREVHRQRQQILDQYGDSVPSEFLSDERLREPAVNSLIQRQILVQSARDQGMSVSNQMLDQLIVETPQFAGETGRFDSTRYQQVLRSMGYTPTQYRSLLAQEIMLNHLTLGIGGSGFVTDDELERFAALNFQSRDFQYLTLSEDRVADEVDVSEADIETYYQNNQDEFRQPEQVAVDYIDLSVDNLMEQIDIDEQTLRQQYEQNLAAADNGEEQRRVAHILFEDADQERVNQVMEQLDAGADFSDLAQEYSDDFGSRDDGGDLGYISAEALPDEFVSTMTQLEVGEVSEPVNTEAGVHIIKVLEDRSSEQPSFEEQRDQIASQLKRVEAESDFVALMDRLGDLSYNADNLGPVAEELGLPIANTGLFGRQGGEGIAGQQPVVEAAFSDEVLERGNSSNLIELAADRVVVVMKTERREAYIQSLDEVRTEIAEQLEQRQIRQLLAERGEEVRLALEEGRPVEAVAEEFNLELSEVTEVERNDPSVGRELLSHVFTLPQPVDEPVVSSVQARDGYKIILLSNVNDGSLQALDEEQRMALRSNLADMLGERDYAAFSGHLSSEADISQ